MLQVRLLGEFHVVHRGQSVAGLGKSRLQSLLGYLLLHADRRQTRAHLAHTFWPDSTEAQARTNLRRELFQLRRSFPQISTYLALDSQTIAAIPGTRCDTDAVAFQAHLLQASTAGNPATQRRQLQAAVDLYHGDLLPGLFDEWIVDMRTVLSEEYARALEALAAQFIME